MARRAAGTVLLGRDRLAHQPGAAGRTFTASSPQHRIRSGLSKTAHSVHCSRLGSPLRRRAQVVLLPPRIVKAAMGSWMPWNGWSWESGRRGLRCTEGTTFPGALWEASRDSKSCQIPCWVLQGWPSEEGQDNQELREHHKNRSEACFCIGCQVRLILLRSMSSPREPPKCPMRGSFRMFRAVPGCRVQPAACSPLQPLSRLSIAVSRSPTGISEVSRVKRQSCRLQFRGGVRTAASATETPRCEGILQKLQTQGGAW